LPVTQSAAKALRRDNRRKRVNNKIKIKYRQALKKARQDPNEENLRSAFSTLDIAAKKKVIHKNKASRLKSRLSKLSNKK